MKSSLSIWHYAVSVSWWWWFFSIFAAFLENMNLNLYWFFRFVLIFELLDQLSRFPFFMSHVWFRTVISGGNWPKSCILFCFCKRKETNFEVSQKFLKTMICKKFMNLTNYRWVKLLTFYHSIVANQLITHCESGNAVPVVALGRPLVIADDGSGHLNPVEILFI